VEIAMPRSEWTREAIRKIEADFNRSADTHLIPLDLPGYPGIHFYFKDESSHPTGSLKHRLARSLFLYALCNGWLSEKSTVVEASSGSTAISEAYFARLLGLPFVAVIPAGTSQAKIAAIEFYGGHCHLVGNPADIYAQSHRLATETAGHFMDQFTYAERATDWRANNNIAESIFKQMANEKYPVPTWIVSSGGTGGTIATLGRYVAYSRHETRILCADPENSVFFDYFKRASVVRGLNAPLFRPVSTQCSRCRMHCPLLQCAIWQAALDVAWGARRAPISWVSCIWPSA
jgi:cysteine synthase A